MKSTAQLWTSAKNYARRYASSGHQKAPAYFHHIGKEPLAYRTLGQHLDVAVQRFANTEAIVSCHEDKRYTFAALQAEVDRLAAGFIRLGLKAGDPIGIWAPNKINWYLSMLAAAKAGLASVGINPAFQGPEVDYCLQRVEVKAIIAPDTFKTQKYYDILQSICAELKDAKPGDIRSARLPHLKTVIIDSKDKFPGAFNFDDVLNLGDSTEAVSKVHALQRFISPDSPCNVQFTSGSTGKPKATMLSHFNIINNGIHIGDRNELSGQRICVQVPLFHAFGVAASIAGGMSHGATLVLPAAGFSPADSLRAIANEKCTVVHGTPTMYVDLIRKQKELNLPIKTVKTAVIGGSPCSPQLVKDMKKVLGIEKAKAIFGLTETTCVVFQSMAVEKEDRILSSVGHVVDHIEAKVIDADGHMVAFGEPGELCVRGYAVMLEYFQDEEKTKEILASDKWLKTGDQFVLHEDGYGQIVGRLKEMIIRGGENIFPREVEDFLNTHPDIIETHVIGIKDDRLGEEVCAFIRLSDGIKDLTQEDVKKFCKGNIAHFKVPRYVKVVNEFPKTTSGKIQKFKLKELFKNAQ